MPENDTDLYVQQMTELQSAAFLEKAQQNSELVAVLHAVNHANEWMGQPQVAGDPAPTGTTTECLIELHDPMAPSHTVAEHAADHAAGDRHWPKTAELNLAPTAEHALDKADVIVLATAWPEYAGLVVRHLDALRQKQKLANARKPHRPLLVVDARGEVARAIGYQPTPQGLPGGCTLVSFSGQTVVGECDDEDDIPF